MPQLGNIFVLMGLVLLIFSLLGMQVFGGAFKPENGFSLDPCPGGVCANGPDGRALEEKPRYHFDYFGPAMMTCFIIMTGAWIDPLGPAVEVAGGAAIAFVVSVVLVGCYVITNLFIAILLNAFADGDEEEVRRTLGGGHRAPPLPAHRTPQLTVVPLLPTRASSSSGR